MSGSSGWSQTAAVAAVGTVLGGSRGANTVYTAAVSGRNGWSQTAAVATVGTVLGGCRGANTSPFHMPHLTFYTVAYVQLPHTHAFIFRCFTKTCRNALRSDMVIIGTDALSALCT